MSGRLASSVLASALIRLAEQAGGHAMVLHKGDAEAGAFLLEIYEKGRFCRFLERIWMIDGAYRWQTVALAAGEMEPERADFRARRLRNDPDLWMIELDIADEQRFIAEIPVGA